MFALVSVAFNLYCSSILIFFLFINLCMNILTMPCQYFSKKNLANVEICVIWGVQKKKSISAFVSSVAGEKN